MSRDLTVQRDNLSQVAGKNCRDRQGANKPDTWRWDNRRLQV